MAKDWKVEYDTLKGQLIEQNKEILYLRTQLERQHDRDREFRERAQELLIALVGNK